MIDFKIFDIFNIFKSFNLGIGTNVCIQVDYDGSKYYGYIYGSLGSSDPDQTNDGQIFYSFIWDNAGNFIMQFGLAGDEPVPGTASLFIYSPGFNKGRLALWDSVNAQYQFTDLQLATDLIAEFNNGKTEVCLYLSIEDGLVIDYNYDTILTGKKNYSTIIEYAHVLGTNSIEIAWNQAEASDSTYELFIDGTSIYSGSDTAFIGPYLYAGLILASMPIF